MLYADESNNVWQLMAVQGRLVSC